MTSETDQQFVERIKREWDGDNVPCVEDFDQLINLARRGAAVQWRPIEEAPKDGTHILVTNGKRQAAAYWWPAVWMGTTHCGMNEPTHWMPLPPPPAGETNER